MAAEAMDVAYLTFRSSMLKQLGIALQHIAASLESYVCWFVGLNFCAGHDSFSNAREAQSCIGSSCDSQLHQRIRKSGRGG